MASFNFLKRPSENGMSIMVVELGMGEAYRIPQKADISFLLSTFSQNISLISEQEFLHLPFAPTQRINKQRSEIIFS